MSNSPLVQYTKISPNKNTPRNHKIDKITIHHMAGVLSAETCGNIFAPTSRQASSNYGIGYDGKIGMYVEEKDRSWCSSSPSNDHRAITIEVSNSSNGGDWLISDNVLNRLIELCTDICKRNGIERLNYTGDANGNLTRHNMFAKTTCPGPYLQSKFPYIAEEVNKRLKPPKPSVSETTYTVVKGDTLSGIAAKYGTTYQNLAAYNGIANPNIIHIGQVIKIPSNNPTPSSSVKYTVQSGDNLSKIATRYGIIWQKIYADNKSVIGANPNVIHIGQVLTINK